MMKIKIKSHMIIDDFCTTPENYIPSNIYEFDISFSFNIGFEDSDAMEIFYVTVSNKCCKHQIVYTVDNIRFSKGCVEVDCYNYINTMSAITEYLTSINANSWDEALIELRKVFQWEYDNYETLTP